MRARLEADGRVAFARNSHGEVGVRGRSVVAIGVGVGVLLIPELEPKLVPQLRQQARCLDEDWKLGFWQGKKKGRKGLSERWISALERKDAESRAGLRRGGQTAGEGKGKGQSQLCTLVLLVSSPFTTDPPSEQDQNQSPHHPCLLLRPSLILLATFFDVACRC